MSVSRDIEIRILSNVSCLSEFIEKFTDDFWNFKNESGNFYLIPANDDGDFNYETFDNVEIVNNFLDKRESEEKINAIVLWDKEYTESFGLLIYVLENKYVETNKHYRLSFTPDTAKRIVGSSRLTDYGYYLNQLVPKLISIGCYICEVKCRDFDC